MDYCLAVLVSRNNYKLLYVSTEFSEKHVYVLVRFISEKNLSSRFNKALLISKLRADNSLK